VRGNAPSYKTLTFAKDQSGGWVLKDYVTYNFIGSVASKSKLNQYYDFDQAFCPNTAVESVGDCFSKHMTGNRVDQAMMDLIKQHYTAGNPNNPTPSYDRSSGNHHDNGE
jgi:hypothetical protein